MAFSKMAASHTVIVTGNTKKEAVQRFGHVAQ